MFTPRHGPASAHERGDRPVGERSGSVHARRRRAAPIAALLIWAGCSNTGPSSGPQAIDATPMDQGGEITDATLTPVAVWGSGRARLVSATSDGGLLVVTTTGLVWVPASGDARTIEEFSAGTQPVDVTVAADGTAAAIAFASPPSVHRYTLGDEPQESTQWGLDSPARSVHLVAGRLIADTATGPLLLAPDGTTSALASGPSGGLAAVLPDGSVAVARTDTPSLERIAGDGARASIALPLAEGEMPLDVRASPTGSVLAVSSGAGENLFERKDRITVVDVVTGTVLGTVDTGRVLDPTQWTITDHGLIIGDGPAVEAYAMDGSTIDVDMPVDSSIGRLVSVATGFVSTHADGSLVTWALPEWTTSIVRPSMPIDTVTISSDGSLITTVDRFGGIEVRRTDTSTLLQDEDRFASGSLAGVAVAADGTVAVASNLGRVDVLSETLTRADQLQVSETPIDVDTVAFDPAGSMVVSTVAERLSETAFDDSVTLWDLGSRSQRLQVGGEAEDVSGCSFFYGRVSFSADGSLMAVASHDFSVEVVGLESGEIVHRFEGDTTVLDLVFSPDGELLVATYDDGVVRAWRTADFELEASYRGAQGGYFAVAFLPNGDRMAVADITGTITVIDVLSGELIQTMDGADTRVDDIAISPDGRLLAAPGGIGDVVLWSASSGRQLGSGTGHTAQVSGVAFSSSGDWLATSSEDGTVRTWAISTG